MHTRRRVSIDDELRASLGNGRLLVLFDGW
jgi:hypothetical protein